jgi:hypothetical protein
VPGRGAIRNMDKIRCPRQTIGIGRNFGGFAQFTVTSADAASVHGASVNNTDLSLSANVKR